MLTAVFKKIIVSFIIIFGTLSLSIVGELTCYVPFYTNA